MNLEDKSIMPFGKHLGTIMEEVPAKYLLFIYDDWLNVKKDTSEKENAVRAYIESNMDALIEEKENN